ncbi:hypothetical protein PHYBOEH_006428 [Phytophthora boehmeriae]|uniref:Exocyst complex component Sec3 C-terminal domain-containing protein n=1 Tax=Phytophthora boehmeriae TaxID=109152 RepID=A0A8T1WGK0_9STRA|nr:hypothetical protein PHYBOEH_006428 [Phytophthora boehmeriae]
MEISKVKPLGNISREDLRHTLHTHFHARATAKSSAVTSAPSRKRVFSFLQVQKPKALAENKRLFGHGNNAAKYFVLCLTVQESPEGNVQLELHYVQLLSNLSVDVRQSWGLKGLDTIEHSGVGPDKTRGAFALFFTGELTACQWVVEARESATAMHEFLWSLCALSVQNNKLLPRLVRINMEELHETATKLNLQKAYELEADLLELVAAMKKNGAIDEHGSVSGASGESTDGKKAVDNSVGVDVSGLRLASPESNEALLLLDDFDWNEVQLSTVEEDLRKKLRALEDENITFLLSLDSEASVAPSPLAGANGSAKSSSVDKILEAIGTVQKRVTFIQDWTDGSDESLGHTSNSMQHFEALNNQLEMHFKNSVSLEEVLSKLMTQVEIPRELMRFFMSPIDIFPGDIGGSSASLSNDRNVASGDGGRGKHELEELTLTMESAFEKLLKRMNEFGEAAGTRNILDALALVGLVSGHLEGYRQQSAFLFNVMVSFQLQMKRMVIRFTEDQETWISTQNVDTKMAGVLAPTKKIVNMIARMEESVGGKSDDSTLISIYNMIVPATMQWVDKIADTRPKYAALTRLENFLFLSENLKVINPSKDLPLAQYAAEAQERYTENLQLYVASVWEYAFKQLVVQFFSLHE